jgi:hypothetical protein
MFKYKKATWFAQTHCLTQEDSLSVASIVEQPYNAEDERYFMRYRLASPYGEGERFGFFADLESAKNELEAKRLEWLSEMLEPLV